MEASAGQFASGQQVCLGCGVGLGAGPACAHERNLVDEISNVVDHVEQSVVHGTEQVAEEVSGRVDGPANSDNHAHGVERSRNSLAALADKAASLTSEDLEQN